jgi:hypothetical protein
MKWEFKGRERENIWEASEQIHDNIETNLQNIAYGQRLESFGSL